jgi:CspA family cold shock protein
VLECRIISGGLIFVSKRIKGVVRWFDGSKGYGYIKAEGQEEIFVHYSAITGNGIKNLLEGDKVEFSLEDSFRGPQAVQVIRLN